MKSPKLMPGQTLGFVEPAGALPDMAKLDRAVALAESLGYRVVVGDSCRSRYGYLAGEDSVRAADINRMFADDDIDAIVCTRGGYGAPRLLDMLDYGLAVKRPKALLGYSDITALHLAYYKMTGLVTYHSMMPTSDWADDWENDFSIRSLGACLSGAQVNAPIENPPGHLARGLSGGVAEGVLLGGNLTLISMLLGTPYMPDLRGAILLIEDVDEHLYRIDRMLTHLRLSGAFEACAGIVLGDFTNCRTEHPDRSLSLDQIIRDVVLPCGKPVVSGLMIGHCVPKISLPLGVRYRLDADAASLTLLEQPYA